MAKPLLIKNGFVVDPLNKIKGEKMEIGIKDGKIVDASSIKGDCTTIDASGMVVMPGGVDLHSHISGAKVNTGRIMRPEDHRKDVVKKTAITHSGVGYSVPSTFVTGYRYSQMGWTTVFEPATPPIKTRHTHEEFNDMPNIDKACFPLFGNNWFVMDYIRDNDIEGLCGFIAWLLRVTKGYAVKLVNPGGVEPFKWGKTAQSIDDPVPYFEVSPSQITSGLLEANEKLGLPHTIHLHGYGLGNPGCVQITKEIFERAKGLGGGKRPVNMHFTHLQFNAYGGTGWKDFSSGASEITDYLNQHKHISFDVGQVIFGDTTTMTADSAWEYNLQHLGSTMPWGQKPGMKWVNGDVEAECGSGVVPYIFSPQVFVNAIQWAIGLELLLLINDPWRSFLTTDHPNGGPFIFYPRIISWLMSKPARDAVLAKCHQLATERTVLKDITREMTIDEIAIVTRAGGAKSLGLTEFGKGHIGVGADGDIAIYNLGMEEKDPVKIEKAFTKAAYTIKSGEILVKNGEIIKVVDGNTFWVDAKVSEDLDLRVKEEVEKKWYKYYSVNLANYPIGPEYLKISRPIMVQANI
ncbi:MAG TPA: formylmethanofuran dehydrogenase subunit A [Candidatus Deferrimicrobium sp.]|nr:formylmethanofuran dehydrogenase subunit A [Candidatus Deferrimicrobium sp.]